MCQPSSPDDRCVGAVARSGTGDAVFTWPRWTPRWLTDLDDCVLHRFGRLRCRMGHHNLSCHGRQDHVRADGSVIR